MKINLKIFKKEFFGIELESDPKIFTGLDLAKPNSEQSIQQLQYVMTDVQYENIKKVLKVLNSCEGLFFPLNMSNVKKDIMQREHKEALNIILEIIKSYEHFKEKREGLENEKSKS